MKLGRDFVVGTASSIWSVVAAFAAVPLFIRFLGVEAYGLIGFSSAFQSFLVVLDLGLTPAISRQVARATTDGELGNVRNLLRSMAWIYWGVAVLIAVILALLAPLIARDWLNAAQLPPETIAHALLLMGIQLAIRWPSGLYLGALIGARRIATASIISAGYYTAANLGAVAVLAWVTPSIEGFFWWQVAAALGYTLALQFVAWRALGGARSARFDRLQIRQIMGFAIGMSGVGLASVLLTQLDKMILSRMLSLEAFGYYMLAVLVASGLYRITTPLFNAIYPRFSALVAAERVDTLKALYRITSYLFSAIWFPGILSLILCARPLLLLWTGDPAIAGRAAPLLQLLAAGTALHGTMFFPYAVQLAYADSRLTLLIHVLLLMIQIPLVTVLALHFGATGGALGWLCLYIAYVAIATPLTHRKLLPGIGRQWLLTDVGRPLIVASLFGLAGLWGLPFVGGGSLGQLSVGALLGLLALLTSLALSPHKLRNIKTALAD